MKCDHCQKPDTANKLHLYRNIYKGNRTVRPGKAYFIHADCYGPFTNRQALQVSLETFVHEHKKRGWIMRLFLAPTLFGKVRHLFGWRAGVVSVFRWMFRKP